MKSKEKIFFVKREVMAKDIKEAMEKDGRIYSIEESTEIYDADVEHIGFNKNK